MSNKRREQDDQNRRVAGGGDKKPRRGPEHLYLVLDDWEKGFSIHRIDAESFDTSDGVAGHLPEPPALRLESPAGRVPYNGMSFAALGTKIFAFMTQRCGLVYDSETAVLALGAHAPPPPRMLCGFGTTVAVGEVIYTLTYRSSQGQHSFEAMSATAEGSWAWKTLPPPTPTFRSHVNSYALHPDGCTIFMTTSSNNGCLCTYSFNTKDSAWRWHGEWALPFLGQAHFDSQTNSWIGLRWDGYICSCKVVSPDCLDIAPDWQMTKEKLFYKDDQRHMGASLTCMGTNTNRFCLVECVQREEVELDQALGDCDGCVLHLTIFGLKYNHKGELQTTDHHRPTRSFIISRHRNHFRPIAFWM